MDDSTSNEDSKKAAIGTYKYAKIFKAGGFKLIKLTGDSTTLIDHISVKDRPET